MKYVLRTYALGIFLWSASFVYVSAHEVYVLSPTEVSHALSIPSPSPLAAASAEGAQFLIWGVAALVLVLVLLAISVNKFFERVCDPFLNRLKRYAPLVGRVTLGLSLIASGYYQASFGPELPLSNLTSYSLMMSIALCVLGILIVFNTYARAAAAVGVVFFAFLIWKYNFYMLNYINYLGELLLVLFLASGKKLERYGFLLLRVFFGSAIIFASFYAKFLHSNLALDTIARYHLTNYFHFTPLFLVLGAFLVEAVIGACFILGFEIRFAAIVFTCFLTLSLLFFGEVVWPHLILFGVNIALFCHGYDKYTLERVLFQRGGGEPVI